MKIVLIIVAVFFGIILLAAILGFGFLVPIKQSQSESGVLSGETDNIDSTPESVDVEFTLKTIAQDGKLLFIGVGGDIDGSVNPDLNVRAGEVIRIILVNGDGMVHDLFLPDIDAKTEYVTRVGDRAETIFKVEDLQPGTYVYYCTLPGHRAAGQEGKLVISGPLD